MAHPVHQSIQNAGTKRVQNPISFADLDDPLADLLDDLLPDETKLESKTSMQQSKPEKSLGSPILKSKTHKSLNFSNFLLFIFLCNHQTPNNTCVFLCSSAKAAKKPSELTFDDDKDDLMDALGFDSDKKNAKKKESPLWSNKER